MEHIHVFDYCMCSPLSFFMGNQTCFECAKNITCYSFMRFHAWAVAPCIEHICTMVQTSNDVINIYLDQHIELPSVCDSSIITEYHTHQLVDFTIHVDPIETSRLRVVCFIAALHIFIAICLSFLISEDKPDTSYRISSLDAFRGICFMIVVLAHSFHRFVGERWDPTHVSTLLYSDERLFHDWGSCAVSGFLCLSGFLMTHINHHQPMNKFLFLLKRAVRLWPLVAVAVFANQMIATNPNFHEDQRNLLFIDNLFCMSTENLTGHLWTVSLEMQLYVLSAIFSTIPSRHQRVAALVAFTAVGIARGFISVTRGIGDKGDWSISYKECPMSFMYMYTSPILRSNTFFMGIFAWHAS
jgi:hypothetical protein